MDLEAWVRRAASGDLDAFADVTRQFQHMAFGYALSFVRDFQEAEDVVQEAFVAAWYALPTLAEPGAFAAWLRSIVRHQAHRVLRRKQLEVVPLGAVDTVPADVVHADHRLERDQQIGTVFSAIADLPRTLREVVVLFYVHDCSQQDIATFLISSLSPGMTVMSAGREIAPPVSREAFDRIVELLAASSLAPGTLVQTGIKVIDVMCPLLAGGTLAIAGEWKAGTAVMLEELVRRLSGGTDRVSIFTFVPGGGTMTYREMIEKEGYSDGTIGAVQSFFFRREDGPWTSETLSTLKGVDVVIRLSEALGTLGIYPCVEPLTSRSRLFESPALGREHLEIATRVRESLALLARDPVEVDPLSVARVGETRRAAIPEPHRRRGRFLARPEERNAGNDHWRATAADDGRRACARGGTRPRLFRPHFRYRRLGARAAALRNCHVSRRQLHRPKHSRGLYRTRPNHDRESRHRCVPRAGVAGDTSAY